MKIAITGTRGIPNRYGGFEQLAEHLSVGLANRGYEVVVYNPHYHPYLPDQYQGVRIVKKWLPEKFLGSAAHYPYDLACIRHSIRCKADIILECGYASASPFYPRLDFRESRIITHMDGMEWKRPKWSSLARAIILRSEKTAVHHSHAIVCDHRNIASYLEQKYSRASTVISYGVAAEMKYDGSIPDRYGLKPGNYWLLIARLEPENNIRMILEGWASADTGLPIVIVGDHRRGFGKKVYRHHSRNAGVIFLGGIFDRSVLNSLRHHARSVFHGHSVGGTNPSLLEAMACETPIITHDNPYNRRVLQQNGLYYGSAEEIRRILMGLNPSDDHVKQMIRNNLEKIRTQHSWEEVTEQYLDLFEKVLQQE